MLTITWALLLATLIAQSDVSEEAGERDYRPELLCLGGGHGGFVIGEVTGGELPEVVQWSRADGGTVNLGFIRPVVSWPIARGIEVGQAGIVELTGDERPDVVLIELLGHRLLLLEQPAPGSPRGEWARRTVLETGDRRLSDIVGTGDFDRDGHADVVLALFDPFEHVVLFGGGPQATLADCVALPEGLRGPAVLDVVGDGVASIVGASRSSLVWVEATRERGWTVRTIGEVPRSNFYAFACADVDGDGPRDIIAACEETADTDPSPCGTVVAYLNPGDQQGEAPWKEVLLCDGYRSVLSVVPSGLYALGGPFRSRPLEGVYVELPLADARRVVHTPVRFVLDPTEGLKSVFGVGRIHVLGEEVPEREMLVFGAGFTREGAPALGQGIEGGVFVARPAD